MSGCGGPREGNGRSPKAAGEWRRPPAGGSTRARAREAAGARRGQRLIRPCLPCRPQSRTRAALRPARPTRRSGRLLGRCLPAQMLKRGRNVGCCSPRRKRWSWSDAFGSSATCLRPSASSWRACFASRPHRSKSGSRTIATS